MSVLTCPGCDKTFDIKRLTIAALEEIFTGLDLIQCPGCQQATGQDQWIGNTQGCELAADTYFYTGPAKKNKWLGGGKRGGMAIAKQAGPGTGSGTARVISLKEFEFGNQVKDLYCDVSIHIVNDDVTLIGEYMASAGGGRTIMVLCGSGNSAVDYGIG